MAQPMHVRQDEPILSTVAAVEEAEGKPGWAAWLRTDINPRFSDVPILACCLVSGLCDSVAFNASGVFVSMQTGIA